ncbi:MAG: CPBP family intramembrane metalloprotease, partial [Chloroflexi bacterium]|nr:CPBP family intramembrane metalloprotease [Chloroflexota bacterium]
MNKNESIASRIIKGILLILAGLILLVGINWIGKVTSPDTPQTSKNITMLFSSVGTILILYAVGHFLLPSGYVSMNLPDNSGPKHYLQGLAYGSGMILTYLILAVVFGGLSYQGLGKMAVLNIILYFLGFILQGFKEELLIRGLIQDLIAKKSRLLSIILPSVLFALLHLGNDNFSYMAMINTALIGLIFALLTDLSGSLW